MAKSILLTGANGFIGRHLATSLVSTYGTNIICPVRTSCTITGAHVVPILGIDEQANWSQYMEGVTTIIHAAGRVHVMDDYFSDPLTEFRRINVANSLNLARQAAAAGVKRFIFLSTVKVNGEETFNGGVFSEEDPPAPKDAYGLSKYEAEQMLFELAAKTGIEVTIVRLPLIYGPGVKANFESMLRWIKSGIPLPFGAVTNKRSFLYIENLISLIVSCIEKPCAANQIFFASDGQDMSTTELLVQCANALGVKSRLLPVPKNILMAGAILLKKRAVAQRLCGSLQIDISKAKQLLNWTPPLSVEYGLKATANNMFSI